LKSQDPHRSIATNPIAFELVLVELPSSKHTHSFQLRVSAISICSSNIAATRHGLLCFDGEHMLSTTETCAIHYQKLPYHLGLSSCRYHQSNIPITFSCTFQQLGYAAGELLPFAAYSFVHKLNGCCQLPRCSATGCNKQHLHCLCGCRDIAFQTYLYFAAGDGCCVDTSPWFFPLHKL
jgi:hypothetical protein